MPKKQTKTLKQRIFNKKVVALITVSLVAGIGTYVLVFAGAEDNFVDVNQGFQISFREENMAYPRPKGQSFNVDIPIAFQMPKKQLAQTRQVLVMITADTAKVDYKGFTCRNVFPCNVSTWTGKRPTQTQPLREVLCFDVPYNYTNYQDVSNLANGGGVFFTVHYTVLANSLQFDAPNYFAYVGGEASGTCASNPAASNAVWGFKTGSCDFTGSGSSVFYSCDHGPDRIPSVGRPAGGGTQSKGPGTGSGTGGGGGSSANKQGSAPNTIPTSSEQGTAKEHPKVEPSPFFDGKFFSTGSEADKFGLGTTGIGNKKIFTIWIYIAGVLIIAGGLAAWRFWWRPKHSPNHKKTK